MTPARVVNYMLRLRGAEERGGGTVLYVTTSFIIYAACGVCSSSRKMLRRHTYDWEPLFG